MKATNSFNRFVQFDFFLKQKPPRARDFIAVGDTSVPLLFVVNPRSKRYILRLRPDGTARVTIPRRGSLVAARQFVEKQTDWLRRQIDRMAARTVRNTAWQIGSEILFRGELVKIAPGLDDAAKAITFANQTVRITHADQDCRPVIERHLHRLARAELPPRVFFHAQQHHVKAARVTVRNQRSRWGSCSRRGTISLNWRLIQAPPFVADYIILHELMHLRQMNHSPRFWREVENVCPDFLKAERWLKAHSSLLRAL